MAESDRPVTMGELREALTPYLTRDEFKKELQKELQKELKTALAPYLTRDEFKTELATALEKYATREDLFRMRDELRTHFDAVSERFRDEFKWLHEWAEANSGTLAARVEAVERGHGARLDSLETRVTALETRRRRT